MSGDLPDQLFRHAQLEQHGHPRTAHRMAGQQVAKPKWPLAYLTGDRDRYAPPVPVADDRLGPTHQFAQFFDLLVQVDIADRRQESAIAESVPRENLQDILREQESGFRSRLGAFHHQPGLSALPVQVFLPNLE